MTSNECSHGHLARVCPTCECIELEAECERLRAALNEFVKWADKPKGGMGSGLHAIAFPALSAGARREMLQIARAALKTPAKETT